MVRSSSDGVPVVLESDEIETVDVCFVERFPLRRIDAVRRRPFELSV